MAELFQVSDRDFDEKIIRSETPIVVDFWADWCEPCKSMTPMIEELAGKYQGKIRFAQMDVVANRKTPDKFGIRSLPTLIFFEGGEVKHTMIGSYSKRIIEETLEKFFNKTKKTGGY